MKTTTITPAHIVFGDGPPRSTEYDDVYHPAAGAFEQARHVFLKGNGLPGRWRARQHFCIVETGFGLGHNFLATVEAWLVDPQRCARLHFLSIEKHPPSRQDLQRSLEYVLDSSNPSDPLRSVVDELIEQWPPLTANIHLIHLAEGVITLSLVFADVHDGLRELIVAADAFYLDGFSPAKNPQMWDKSVFRAVDRLARDDATAATWSVARVVRDGLHSAGFDLRRIPGLGSKHESLAATRRPLPADRERWPALSRLGEPVGALVKGTVRAEPVEASLSEVEGPTIAIIGAGLAGCHVAAALAAHGLRCTVYDRHPEAAQEASGGTAGIFHGIVHGSDNVHARLHRAAALVAMTSYQQRVREAEGRIDAAFTGLLRLTDGTLADMQAQAKRLALPADWVRAVDAAEATSMARVPIHQACWFFTHGGWIAPQALCRHLLQHPLIRFVGGADVQNLERSSDTWHLQRSDGATLAEANVVVIANAHQATQLCPWAMWPLQTSRGQSTTITAHTPGLEAPQIAMGGNGYALTQADGSVLCGASSHAQDLFTEVRIEDTRSNLERLQRLTASSIDAITCAPQQLSHRVAWRSVTPDRLPIVGAVPDPGAPPRATQIRNLPRAPGLYALTGLGSRGLTLAPLMAEIVVASILQEPIPIEATILDAIDAGRFVAKASMRD